MLRGTFAHALDAKGRIIIPARLREELGENFIIAKGVEHCVSLYPMEAWEHFTERLENLPKISSEPARRLRRFFYGNSMDGEIDKQGRMRLDKRSLALDNLRAAKVCPQLQTLAGIIRKRVPYLVDNLHVLIKFHVYPFLIHLRDQQISAETRKNPAKALFVTAVAVKRHSNRACNCSLLTPSVIKCNRQTRLPVGRRSIGRVIVQCQIPSGSHQTVTRQPSRAVRCLPRGRTPPS